MDELKSASLVLEGGGMRGVYTAGVLDCFLDHNCFFEHIYAVSAGACHACSYVSRQRERGLHTVLDYLEDPRYASWRNWWQTGNFFGVTMVYEDIPYRLIPFDFAAFAAAPAALTAVVTNCRSGQAEYKVVGDLRQDMELIRASSSLPLLSAMVELDGGEYLDGGVVDSIPLARSLADGNQRHVVVLTQDATYRKSPHNLMPMIKWYYRRYPALIEAIRTRHLRYNAALELVAQEERSGAAVVIRPQTPVTISRLEKNRPKLQQLYQDGYADAAAALEKQS
jgi:predicted patatin/cPLA2 family phospholipase